MRSYGQYCPIAKAAEILGDRWTVLIVREISFGVQHFNELNGAPPDLPVRAGPAAAPSRTDRPHPAIRLRLRAQRGLPADRRGQRPQAVLRVLGEWAAHWAFGDPDPAELDPDLLMRWISRHIATAELPDRRVVAQLRAVERDIRGATGSCSSRRRRRCACRIPVSTLTSSSPPTPPPCTGCTWAASPC